MSRLLRVLLVEDSEDDALLVIEELRRGGYDAIAEWVETEEAMQEALQKTWDIVLADNNLPHFNVLAALKLVQESGQDLPFIIVSGQISEDAVVSAMKAGVHNWIIKTNLARLVSTVERELHEASVRNSGEKTRAEKRFRSRIENAWDMILILDEQGVLKYVSPLVQRILGYLPEEVIGRSIFDFICPEDIDRVIDAIDLLVSQPKVSQPSICISVQHKNGSTCILEAVGTNLLNDRAVKGLVVNCHDITQGKQAQEQLRRYAFYDSLTGLPNRALFLEKLGELCKQLQAGKNSDSNHLSHSPQFAILFLEIDRFRTIEYSLGHSIADRLLIATAQRLMEVLNCESQNTKMLGIQHAPLSTRHPKLGTSIARVGIDEFAVLLTQIREIGDAIRIADKVHSSLTKPFNLDGQEVFITASIGIAADNSSYDRPEEFLRAAATALHHAKLQEGKPKSALFDISMQYRAMAGLQLETDLRRAIERQEFALHYQPIVSLSSGRAIGFEALIRWYHPQLGLVPPDAFIPLAEETGLILPMGTWVLREACQQMRQWRAQFPSLEPFTISVNLAGLQLAQPNLVKQIDRILQDTNLQGCELKLELTESILMKTAEVTTLLKQLKSRQIKLSIDDFGTGYSSLSRLHQWPLDTLKIDRSFICRLGRAEDSAALVRTIISLADNLGLEVIAEGVETAEQAYQLWAMQCEAAQGYFFAKPLDSAAATSWLQEKLKVKKHDG